MRAWLMLAVAAAGMIGGAYLIALWAVGLALIAVSAGVAVYAVAVYDDGKPASTLPEPVERWRRAS